MEYKKLAEINKVLEEKRNLLSFSGITTFVENANLLNRLAEHYSYASDLRHSVTTLIETQTLEEVGLDNEDRIIKDAFLLAFEYLYLRGMKTGEIFHAAQFSKLARAIKKLSGDILNYQKTFKDAWGIGVVIRHSYNEYDNLRIDNEDGYPKKVQTPILLKIPRQTTSSKIILYPRWLKIIRIARPMKTKNWLEYFDKNKEGNLFHDIFYTKYPEFKAFKIRLANLPDVAYLHWLAFKKNRKLRYDFEVLTTTQCENGFLKFEFTDDNNKNEIFVGRERFDFINRYRSLNYLPTIILWQEPN